MTTFERYQVRRDQDVRFLVDSIERSGGRLITEPNPRRAPFELRVASPSGEILDLLCYAFHANKYRQKGRPADEHRFQIKYGSEFQRYHEIFIDPGRRVITLMLGVHLEEEILVAVDPAMHNPTWFSKSLEFKDRHVAEVKAAGWSGWERERSEGRRKIEAPLINYQTEALLGLVPERFLDYVSFEKLATGLDPGERLVLFDRFMESAQTRGLHRLESELGFPAWKILDLIDGASRLKVAVRGSIAEEHLRQQLLSISGMDEVEVLDQDGMPDFRVVYRKSRPILIECKNVLRKSPKRRIKVDFQKTRASINDPCSRYYRPEDFDILAACLFPKTERWEFKHCRTTQLASHPKCPGHLSQHVFVEGRDWYDSAVDVLEAVRALG